MLVLGRCCMPPRALICLKVSSVCWMGIGVGLSTGTLIPVAIALMISMGMNMFVSSPPPSQSFNPFHADSEWKWILYEQQASLSDSLSAVKSMDSFLYKVVGDMEPSSVRKASAELSFASVWSDAQKADELSHPHAGIRKPHRVSMLQPSDARAAMATTMNPSLSWHVKDVAAAAIPQRFQAYAEDRNVNFNSQFAEVVSHGYHTHAEKHSLLPSPSCWLWRERGVSAEGFGDLEECDGERKLSETMISEKKAASDSSTPVCKLLAGVGEPHIIPTTLQELSVQDRSLNLADGDKTAAVEASHEIFFNVKKQHGDEILGEALCRAQTRARLAEKLAAQALKERECLAHMLLREVWVACTYKRRAQVLELENRLLKLHRHNVDIDRKSMYPLTQRKLRMSRPKLEQKHRPSQEMKGLCDRHPSALRQRKGSDFSRSWKHRVLLSCTLGLAFVLSLSIAGIGLMIGWSMGWMMYP